jgi:hypothetical protein
MTRAKRVEKASCWLWVGLLGCLASCGSTREVTTLSPSSSPISSTQIAPPPADYAAVVANRADAASRSPATSSPTLTVRPATTVPLPVFRAPARRPEVEPGGSGSAVPSWSSAAVVGPPRATAPKAGTKLTRTQAGRIIDEAGQPLVGATVILKGTARGASTDADGSYSLEVPLGVNTFIFSYSGYQEEIAESRDGQPLTVTLLPLATKAKTKAKP